MRIRIATFRIAEGRVFFGFLASPAVIAVISVPMHEKVACIKAELKGKKVYGEQRQERLPGGKRRHNFMLTKNPRIYQWHLVFRGIGQMDLGFSNTESQFYHGLVHHPSLVRAEWICIKSSKSMTKNLTMNICSPRTIPVMIKDTIVTTLIEANLRESNYQKSHSEISSSPGSVLTKTQTLCNEDAKLLAFIYQNSHP